MPDGQPPSTQVLFLRRRILLVLFGGLSLSFLLFSWARVTDLIGKWEHWAVLTIGLLFTALIVFYLYNALRHTQRVEALARDLQTANLSLKMEMEERERLQDQVRHSQKMDAMGRLAGGVAHDFNNLLTIINGYAQFRLQATKDEALRTDLEEILKAGNRAASLVKQLLAFSRRQIFQPKILDPNTLLNDMDSMLRRLLPSNIQMTSELLKEIWPVKADPHYLEQVILNLVVNASHAMPFGGRIRLSTKNTVLIGSDEALRDGLTAGDYVEISVADTGSGMSKEVLSHLFEPFFTTKSEGKGTGLGLATSYGIVRQSGGTIAVESQPGKGSVFRVYLPRTAGTAAKKTEDEAPIGVSGGTESVLIVEDEASVCRLMSHILTAQGYRVAQAANGEEALKVLEEQDGKSFHLVVTDIVMPVMGGLELADRIRSKYPKLKIIFTTGYTQHILERSRLGVKDIFLQKPFTAQVLARKVRETLDGADA